MNYIEVLNKSQKELKKYNVKNPILDSELLLSKVLKLSREDLLINLHKKITEEERKLVIQEAKEILDVEDVITSILLVEELRVQKN